MVMHIETLLNCQQKNIITKTRDDDHTRARCCKRGVVSQVTQSVVKGAPLDMRVRISIVSPLFDASRSLLPRSTRDRGTAGMFLAGITG